MENKEEVKKVLTDEIKEGLKVDISKYYALDESMKKLKKDHEPLNKKIKEQMGNYSLTDFDAGDYMAVRGVQHREVMNPILLVEKLKELGHKKAIRRVEMPNEEVIQNLIYEGKLNPQDLKCCMETKEVITLSVKPKKKQADTKAKKAQSIKKMEISKEDVGVF